MRKMIEKQRSKKGDIGRISPRDRCEYVREEGKRCKQKAWRGKKLCYQHDPEMGELRRKAGRPRNPVRLKTAREVQELLARTLEELQAGEIGPGEAYAVGYLAQLGLTAQGEARRQAKPDVKHFWEVVDLGAAIERAVKMQEERKKEREAKEAESLASPGEAQDKEGDSV